MNLQELKIQRALLDKQIAQLEAGKPATIKTPVITDELIMAADECIQAYLEGSSKLDNYEHLLFRKQIVFERAMEAIYGKTVWDWINEVM